MRKLEYTISADCAGVLLKDFARKRLGLSARFLAEQKRLENGILKNGIPCRVTEPLFPGDRVAFCLPEERGEYDAVPAPLEILFENEDFLAVNKPAAMPIHPSPGHDRDSLLNAVAYHYRKTGQSCLIRPLYRLDKDTSGVVLIGKHRAAVCGSRTEKTYYAVCEGTLSGSGIIDLPIGLEPGSRIRRECGFGQPALTRWKALASAESYTLLSVTLETGRTHQIRVHLSHTGHPLAGDDLYGGSLDRIARQALHCGAVHLVCPAAEFDQLFRAPLPEEFPAAFPELLCSASIL